MSTTTILLIVGGVALMLLMHRIGHGAHGGAAHAGAHGRTVDVSPADDATSTTESRERQGADPHAEGDHEGHDHEAHPARSTAEQGDERPRKRHGCC